MTMVPTQGKSCCNRCFLFFSRSRLLPSALLVAAESLAADTFFLHMRQSKNGGNRTLKMVVTTYLIETAHHFINCWWRGNFKTVELYGLIPALISFFFGPQIISSALSAAAAAAAKETPTSFVPSVRLPVSKIRISSAH